MFNDLSHITVYLTYLFQYYHYVLFIDSVTPSQNVNPKDNRKSASVMYAL